MNSDASGLSSFQTGTLCAVSSALGTVCLASFYGNGADGSWAYAVLICSLFASVMTAVYMRTVCRCSADSLRGLLDMFLPKIVSVPLLIAACIFFIAEAAVSAFCAQQAVSIYLLENTPPPVILAALVLTAAVISAGGMRYLARSCEILIQLLVLPLALLLILCLTNIDLREAAVVFQPDIPGIVRMLPAALLSAGGCAAAVIFISCKNSRNTGAAFAGYFSSAAVSVLLCLCSAGIFTADGTARFEFPFIEAVRSVTVGTISLTERFDTVFIAIMLTAQILQLGLLCCCAANCLKGVFSRFRLMHTVITVLVFTAAYCAQLDGALPVLTAVSLRGILSLMLVVTAILSGASIIFRKGAHHA